MDGPTSSRASGRVLAGLLVVALAAGCASVAVSSPEPSIAPAVVAASPPATTVVPGTPGPTPHAATTTAATSLVGLPTIDRAPVAVIDTRILRKDGDLAGLFNTIGVAGGEVWFGSPAGLVRLDPSANQTKVIDTDAGAWVAGMGDSVWRSAFYFNTLKRYDATTGRVALTVDVPEPGGVLPTKSTIWLSERNEGTILGLDPRTGDTRITRTITSAGHAGPGEITLAAGALWIVVPRAGTVVKVDPDDGVILATIDLGFHPGERLTYAGGALWAQATPWEGETPPQPGTLIRIDPVTQKVTTSIVPENQGLVAEVEGEAWLPVGDALVLLDRASGRPVRMVRFGLDGYQAWVVRDALAGLWVASYDDTRIVRLSPSDLRPLAR